MKTLALLVTLVLHTAGVWNHLPSNARSTLTAATEHGLSTRAVSIPVRPVEPGPIPVQIGAEPLSLAATSAYALDPATGTVLYAQNAAVPRPIASVTKIATALVILSRHATTETVRIPTLPSYQTADETIGLVPGESYHIGDLIRAALIPSANDAADALAIADAGTIPRFAARMNAKMSEWGITGAHFSNPTGLQDSGNAVSAEALGKIAALAIQNPFIRQTVAQTQATISSTSGRTLSFTTTDNLLASGQFYGIKTGYTPAAGECFVGLTRINGHEVITVVLGADDRFGVTQDLTNWIGRNWQWL